jgi:hypothetical protein
MEYWDVVVPRLKKKNASIETKKTPDSRAVQETNLITETWLGII